MFTIELPGQHDARASLCHPIAAVEIDLDDRSELVGGFLECGYGGADSGIVDKNVYAPIGSHSRLDEGCAVVGVRDVGAYGDRAASGVFDEGAGFCEAVRSAGAEGEVGAGFGERGSESDAQTAGCAGQDGDPAVESESVEDGHWVPFVVDVSVGKVITRRTYSPGASPTGG